MDTVKKWLKNEFVNGQTMFDWMFLAAGIALQIVAIVYQFLYPGGMSTSELVWTSICGLFGVITVIWYAQRKISAYIAGFIQLFTYLFAVAIPNHLWGEVGENIFYFVTMVAGVFIWLKHYENKDEGNAVEAKTLSPLGFIATGVCFLGISYLLTAILSNTTDPMPFYDSITTVAPFVAQILLTFGYREQWAFWVIEDIFSVIMFALLGNWIMTIQYVFWTINCIYGWYKWTEAKA